MNNSNTSHLLKKKFCGLLLLVTLLLSFGTVAFAETTIDLEETLTVPEMARFIIRNSFYFDYEEKGIQTDDVDAMLKSLNDPYSVYYSPEAFAAYMNNLENERPMLGVYYTAQQGIGLVVSGTIEGSAAAEAGLQSGDIITKVNDMDMTTATEAEIAVSLTLSVGDSLELTIQRGEETLQKTLVVKEVINPSIEYEIIENGIGYVHIAQFDEATASEVRTAVNMMRVQGVKVLMLDLRECPGGLVSTLQEIASCFVPEGPVAFFRYRGGKEQFIKVDGYDYYSDMPIVTLINGHSASAAEFLAGAMQDAKSSVLVGEKTYGKGLMQNIYSLKDGSGFSLTTAQVFTRGYQNIKEQGGVLPDVPVSGAQEQYDVALAMCRNLLHAGDITLRLGSTSMTTERGDVTLAVAPQEINGVTYAPLRQVANALGAWVEYREDGKVYLTYQGEQFIINPQTGRISKDGYIYNDKVLVSKGNTLIPVRFFAEQFDAKVEWQPENHTIKISR